MTNKQFYQMLKKFQQDELTVMQSKGLEYCLGSDDKLANFKSIARRTQTDALVVWAVYFLKHIDSIMSYIKHRRVYSEPIRSRIIYARNYLALLLALITESQRIGHGRTRTPVRSRT